MMSVLSPGKRSCQNGSVKLLRGSFQPQMRDRSNPSDQQPRLHAQRIESDMFEVLAGLRWEIPGATQLI